MFRSTILAGSIAIFAFAGVDAGPCRPSSAISTSSLETTYFSTSISLSTAEAVSTTTDPTTTEVTSTTADSTTTEASISTAYSTTTEAASTTADSTTTEAAATTAQPTTAETAITTTDITTSAITTTSAAKPSGCSGLPNPYYTDSASFNIGCDSDFGSSVLYSFGASYDFEQCIGLCATDSQCAGVKFYKATSICSLLFSYDGGIHSADDTNIALKNE